MTEWSLPTKARRELEDVLDRLKAARPARPGAPVHARRHVAQFQGEVRRGRADVRADDRGQPARRRPRRRPGTSRRRGCALYRGQCNCAYWHGVFGGLYMPFLRFAIYEQLLKAEESPGRPSRASRPARRRPGPRRPPGGEAPQPRAELLSEAGPRRRALRAGRPRARLEPDGGDDAPARGDAPETGRSGAVRQGPRRAARRAARRASTTWCAARNRASRSSCSTIRTCGNRCSTISTRPMPPSAALQRSEVAEWGDFIGAEYDLKAPPSRGSSVTLSRSRTGRSAGPQGAGADFQAHHARQRRHARSALRARLSRKARRRTPSSASSSTSA